MTLHSLVDKISNGEIPPQEDFRIVLQNPSVRERAEGCQRILQALLKLDTPAALQLTVTFAKRTWELSGYSEAVLPVVVDAFSKLRRIDDLRLVYRQIASKASKAGDVMSALKYFDLWQNAYVHRLKIDRFDFDREVLEMIDALAGPWRLSPEKAWASRVGRKVRVAFLASDIALVGSVMVKIQLLIAQNIDRERFEAIICVPHSRAAVELSAAGRDNLECFTDAGCEFVFLHGELSESSIHRFAQEIGEKMPDVLFTAAGIARMTDYYISALHPAPLTIALLQGPHAQFVSPSYDGAIAWIGQLITDSPIDCDQVDLEINLPIPVEIPASLIRAELGLSETANVVLCGGRPQKFQDPNFWRAMGKVLDANPDSYFLLIGPNREDIEFLSSVASPAAIDRMKFVGWRSDYLKYISIADVALDTFPSGGGVLLFEVMALGVPFIGFENDELKIFDQVEWSAINGHVKNETLILPRNNWSVFENTVSGVLKGTAHKRDVAIENQQHIRVKSGNPLRMTRNIERVFIDHFDKKFGEIGFRAAGRSSDFRVGSENSPDLLESKERSLEKRERELQAKQEEILKHAAYCDAKERELQAAWSRYNSVIAGASKTPNLIAKLSRLVSKVRRHLIG